MLFDNPEHTSPRISPDGKQIAFLAPDQGVLNIWVRSLADETAQVMTQDRDRGIRLFFWVQDSRHLLYLQDRGGNENWRLLSKRLKVCQTLQTGQDLPLSKVPCTWVKDWPDAPFRVQKQIALA